MDKKKKDQKDNDYYSDDVSAAAIADNNLDPDKLKESKDKYQEPISSGEMNIGDLDAKEEEDKDGTMSRDEENDPVAD